MGILGDWQANNFFVGVCVYTNNQRSPHGFSSPNMPTDLLAHAFAIAARAHAYQYDKVGQPYLLHLVRVMQRLHTEEEKICALLHDLLEDTPWTAEALANEGFSASIITAVQTLTKGEHEDYQSFINRVQSNPLAKRVKIADLEDNMDIRRLASLSPSDITRLQKYLAAYHQLTQS